MTKQSYALTNRDCFTSFAKTNLHSQVVHSKSGESMNFTVFTLFPILILVTASLLLVWWVRIFSHPSRIGEERASRVGAAVSMAFLLWAILATIVQGQAPVLNIGQLLYFLGILIWAAQSYLQMRVRQRMLVLLPLAVIVVMFLSGIILGIERPDQVATHLAGGTTGFHMVLSMAGVAMLLGSGVFAAEQLTLHRHLRNRTFGRWFSYLPSLEDLDRLRRHTLKAGWFIVTVSLVIALLWMQFGVGDKRPIISHLHPMLTLWTILTIIVLANRYGWLAINKLALSSVILSALVLVLLLVSLYEIFGKKLA